MSDLVTRLTVPQPIEASLRPETTLEHFRAAIERGYVHIKFTGTRGGTELGIRLDPAETDLSSGDLQAGTGSVQLAGNLILDYVPVRFRGTIRLSDLAGSGQLEIRRESAA